MKFTCEQCGKRFASVDAPAAGRVYRIKCKCGNVIHITAPHADSEADKGPGATPSRPRITGATAIGAAMPPVPTTARSAISAGDAGTRVHAAPAPARVQDPAVPRRTEPIVRATTPATPVKPQLATPVTPHRAEPVSQAPQRAETVSPAPQRATLTATARALTGLTPAVRTAAPQSANGLPPPRYPTSVSATPARSVTGSHPLATPVESLDPELPPAPFELSDGAASAPGENAASPNIPLDLFSDPFAPFSGGAEPSQTMPVEPPPAPPPAPPAAARTVGRGPAAGNAGAAAPPDPFAVAAAHAARGAPYDTTAPLVTGRPGAKPAANGQTQGPGHDDETSIELSVSEQYELPKSPKKKAGSKLGLVLGIAAVVLAAAGGGAYWFLGRGVEPLPRVTVGKPAAPSPPPVAQVPPPSPAPAAAPTPAPAPAEAAAPAAPVAPPAPALAAPLSPPPAQAAAPSPAPPAPAAAPAPPAPPPAAAQPAREAAAENAAAQAAREAAQRDAAAKAAAAKEAREVAARESAAKLAADREAAARQAAAAREAAAARTAADREAAARAAAAKAVADREAAAKQAAAAKVAAERDAAAKQAAAAKVAADREAAAKQAAATRAPPARQQPTQGLDPAVMQSVIAKSRPEFDACTEKALKDPVTSSFAGRKAALLLLVSPNGKAEAALEDSDLDASPFGACLRRAAGKMSFPTFVGEEVGARIVLVLGKGN